jgi:selenocysteine lyase/cysteine desulfurase
MNKRTFLSQSMLGLLAPKAFLEKNEFEINIKEENGLIDWKKVRKQYKLPNFINLENGYYAITPQPILKKYYEHIEYVNGLGAYYMRNYQFENKNKVRDKLANLVMAPKDELIITRNTTESLDLIISGFPWSIGDEAIMAYTDYGAMLDMFAQVEKRHGMICKYIEVPLNPLSDEEIVTKYEKAITSKTKLIMVCHMVNVTGQILPIKKICDMAHNHGVQVMVDGAHCVAHLDFAISDLNCDYYAASLHKWLSNPLGAGILYMKKVHIPNIYPLIAESPKDPNDISRLNHTGTLPVYTDLVISDAIDYYFNLGKQDKENRLRFLQNYWLDQIKTNQKIIINTPDDKSRSCAIANIGIKGMKPHELAKKLYENYNIYTVAIDNEYIKGCRITPNVYTTEKELDKLVYALSRLSAT